MKFLNANELAKKIYLDYEGNAFNAYKFKISNSPNIRVSKNGVIKNCTCLFHSVKDVKIKKDCRYVEAFKIWQKEASELINYCLE